MGSREMRALSTRSPALTTQPLGSLLGAQLLFADAYTLL